MSVILLKYVLIIFSLEVCSLKFSALDIKIIMKQHINSNHCYTEVFHKLMLLLRK